METDFEAIGFFTPAGGKLNIQKMIPIDANRNPNRVMPDRNALVFHQIWEIREWADTFTYVGQMELLKIIAFWMNPRLEVCIPLLQWTA